MKRKQNLWAIGDLHFDHRNIILYSKRIMFLSPAELELYKKDPKGKTWRPSNESVHRMNNHFIDQINKYVHEDDILWNLGDFLMGSKNMDSYLRRAEHFYYSIKCKNHYLVQGNHDPDYLFRIFQKRIEDSNGNPILDWKGDRQYYGAYPKYMIRWNGIKIHMDHCAGAIWPKNHKGAIMLYGHSHGGAETLLDRVFPGRKSIDVGIDNIYNLFGEYRPANIDDDIMPILNKRKGCFIDHHEE